jgi:2-oxo-4-hydroxy-4-carboxy-5-ureidoimidazoline decarboxylase
MSLTLSDMNEMDFDIFVEKFGNIIEHSALVSAALWTRRPFSSIQHILEEISGIVQSLPDDGKLLMIV